MTRVEDTISISREDVSTGTIDFLLTLVRSKTAAGTKYISIAYVHRRGNKHSRRKMKG